MTESTCVPTFISLALRAIEDPDYADVQLIRLPAQVADRLRKDPARAARDVFSVRKVPAPIKALFAVRQAAVRVIGLPASPPDVFKVVALEGSEALIAADEPHLDFRVGVAVQDNLLRVTTTVRLKGMRGRLYFAPVRLAHPIITRAMMRAAIRRWSTE